jgi:thermolysin metallopeptidase-like protein
MSRLPENATYQIAADNTFDIAGSLFGEQSTEQKAVLETWHEVGVEAKKPDVTVLFAGLAKKIAKSN